MYWRHIECFSIFSRFSMYFLYFLLENMKINVYIL